MQAERSTGLGSSNKGTWAVIRRTYDAQNRSGGEFKLVRSEGDAPTGDKIVDAIHDNAKTVFDFYRDVLDRNGIDGKGAPIVSVAHARFGLGPFATANNAAWDGQKMLYGDGDGKTFAPFAYALDVATHEMTHGVTQHEANLRYQGQSGALNESWSDVFGELVQMWKENPSRFDDPAYAREHKWVAGEDIFTPDIPGDAARSLEAPGTAYPGDKQPAHMRNYVNTTSDNGGVHTNSGIPNKAAYETAIKIGGEKLAKIWYSALSDGMKSDARFTDGAKATVEAAQKLYGNDPQISQAVQDAWLSVGVDYKAKTEENPTKTPFLTKFSTLSNQSSAKNSGWAGIYS